MFGMAGTCWSVQTEMSHKISLLLEQNTILT